MADFLKHWAGFIENSLVVPLNRRVRRRPVEATSGPEGLARHVVRNRASLQFILDPNSVALLVAHYLKGIGGKRRADLSLALFNLVGKVALGGSSSLNAPLLDSLGGLQGSIVEAVVRSGVERDL